MYRLSDGHLVLSASDLTNHLGCAHLTQVKLAVARGERALGRRSPSAHASLVRERGVAHELAQLERLAADCGGVLDCTRESERDAAGARQWPPRRTWLEAGHEETVAAMRSGAPLLFQATLFNGRWQGIADFVRRVDLADALSDHERALIAQSTLGGYVYEVLDSKLAKEAKPYVVHQLSLYADIIGAIQGVRWPFAHVVVGNGEVLPVPLDAYAALHRRVVRRYEAVTNAPALATSFPEPTPHCGICDLAMQCTQERRRVDHLSLVARAGRNQRTRLVAAGVETLTALASMPDEVVVDGLSPPQLDRLRHQAALQRTTRDTGERTRRHLPVERAAGYAALPKPDPADLFFDFEGDPYVGTDGIEYLWGWSSVAEGVALPGTQDSYACILAHEPEQERLALEAFVDVVVARRREHPGMHVYHYSAVERSTLLTLAMRYSTREAAVDQLVRDGVFVDLYAIVLRALQVGEESYSLKRLEAHHGFTRHERSVRDGGGSIVAYEAWRAGVIENDTGALRAMTQPERDALLESIRAYNEEDCRSTAALRDWMWETLRPEAAAELGVDFDELRRPERAADRAEPPYVAELAQRRARLHHGLPATSTDDDGEQAARRLLGELLLYHRREEKPQWWEQFRLAGLAPEELTDERTALGGLTLLEGPLPATSQSDEYRMAFPPQEFKRPKDRDLRTLADPSQFGAQSGVRVTVQSIDDDARELVVRRAKKHANAPLPRALMPTGLPNAVDLRGALAALADAMLADDASQFPAAQAILRRSAPRLLGDTTLGETTDELCAATLALDRSVLPVQGPPGTGKTYNAARMIVAALAAGRRVGITAQSHAAIRNVLRAVEQFAQDSGASPFSGFYKGEPGEFVSTTGWIDVVNDNAPAEPAGKTGGSDAQRSGGAPLPQLVAGTAWLFSRPSQRELFDVLFVDEAGQFALANALAVATAATSVVLLGDPQQLSQVTQGMHPVGAGASVLEHLLGGHATVPADRGVLLSTTWRMHPHVTEWVSATSYDGRLAAAPDCGARRVDVVTPRSAAGDECGAKEPPGPSLVGAGLRVIEVMHDGRSQSSEEEATAIADACNRLLDGGTVTEPQRATAPELLAVARDVDADTPPSPTEVLRRPGALITRPLRPRDLMVVAPYNLAVQLIAQHVPDGVRVGTVDTFQGQEASVVFYALTCSSADDVPRGLDFLFDANRLNVAISRAQALAVLVHCPRLLDADCKTLPTMRRVSVMCGLVEVAQTAGVVPVAASS
jgi:predicted RecB family nuclease